jgi:hypothetical protein
MKQEPSTKLIVMEMTIQGIWAASKHMVHKSKKTYNKKDKSWKKETK